MHSGGLELLTYSRHEDNLLRYRGDDVHIVYIEYGVARFPEI